MNDGAIIEHRRQIGAGNWLGSEQFVLRSAGKNSQRINPLIEGDVRSSGRFQEDCSGTGVAKVDNQIDIDPILTTGFDEFDVEVYGKFAAIFGWNSGHGNFAAPTGFKIRVVSTGEMGNFKVVRRFIVDFIDVEEKAAGVQAEVGLDGEPEHRAVAFRPIFGQIELITNPRHFAGETFERAAVFDRKRFEF